MATDEDAPAAVVAGGAVAPARRDAPNVRALGVALAASLLLWQLPFAGFLLYPFKLLATWMHELSHGLVMLVSGPGFDRMEIYRDSSGISFAAGATDRLHRALIAPAGYMGTPAFGAILLVVGQEARGARWGLGGLGAAIGLCTILVVANEFGQIATAAMSATLLVAAVALPARAVIAAVNVVAAQACVNALLDIRVLFRPTLYVDGRPSGASDAQNMADATFGTTASWAVWLWAALWLAWSLALLYLAVRRVNQRRAA